MHEVSESTLCTYNALWKCVGVSCLTIRTGCHSVLAKVSWDQVIEQIVNLVSH